jgi:hypothetical protein
LFEPRLTGEYALFHLTEPMNWKQKNLTGLALLALLVSAANAPWILIHPGTLLVGDPRTVNIIYAPLWSPPAFGNHISDAGWIGDECQLNTTLLFCTWFVIGAAYAGLFFLLKTKAKKTGTGETGKFSKN